MSDFTVSLSFITGCVVGLEFASGEDMDDPSINMAIAIDLAIVRIVLTFFRMRHV